MKEGTSALLLFLLLGFGWACLQPKMELGFLHHHIGLRESKLIWFVSQVKWLLGWPLGWA